MIGLQLLGLLVFGVFGIAFTCLAATLGGLPIKLEFGAREIPIALAGGVATIILHELVHGGTIRRFVAEPVRVMWRQLMFYATSPGYFEVQVDDFKRAQAFYREVFGWVFSKIDVPFEYYSVNTGHKGGESINGGMLKRQKPLLANNGVSGYVCAVYVDSIDQTLEKVRQDFPRSQYPCGL